MNAADDSSRKDDGHLGQPSGFDERAATWDENPEHVERAQAIAAAIIEAVPLGPATRVLEYGAGTGLVSQALRAHVGPITLADTSDGMRAVIQSKIGAGALGPATVWDVDLATTPAPAGDQFDLIVTVMTLHHILDLAPVLDAFRQLLAPGGHLCIADLEHEDGSFHGDGFHGHHGFAPPALAAALHAAGFSAPAFSTPHRVERDGRSYPIFLAVTSPRHGTARTA